MQNSQLQQLGFSKKEAEIYLALLKFGPSAASTIATRLNIKRPSVYDALNHLTQRNLIASFKQGQNTFFYIDDVNKIFLEQKEKSILAQTLTGTLKQIQNSDDQISINYYRGLTGFREVYEEILSSDTKTLKGWMNLEKFYQNLDTEYERNWTLRRIELGIKVQLILQENFTAIEFRKSDKQENRQTRLASTTQFPFETSCILYSNCITFFEPSQESLSAFRLRSTSLHQMLESTFAMSWQGLTKR